MNYDPNQLRLDVPKLSERDGRFLLDWANTVEATRGEFCPAFIVWLQLVATEVIESRLNPQYELGMVDLPPGIAGYRATERDGEVFGDFLQGLHYLARQTMPETVGRWLDAVSEQVVLLAAANLREVGRLNECLT